jgi:hypothetical protein
VSGCICQTCVFHRQQAYFVGDGFPCFCRSCQKHRKEPVEPARQEAAREAEA